MNYLVGIVLAVVACGLALRLSSQQRRWFFPVMVVMVAVFDVAFALMAGDARALLYESTILLGYVALALLSYRFSLWLSVAALAAHGLFDLTHSALFQNSGIPEWWPGFCMAYDVAAALLLAAILAAEVARSCRCTGQIAQS